MCTSPVQYGNTAMLKSRNGLSARLASKIPLGAGGAGATCAAELGSQHAIAQRGVPARIATFEPHCELVRAAAVIPEPPRRAVRSSEPRGRDLDPAATRSIRVARAFRHRRAVASAAANAQAIPQSIDA